MGARIELIKATRAFAGAPAVSDLTLCAEAGSTLALLGPSGSGKSTALRLIAGLEPLDSGEVRLDGAVLARAGWSEPPERRRIGVVFQDYALFPHMTLRDNVAFGLRGHAKETARARARDWLERVGLGHRERAYPHELSGGEQQRVALARALAPRPEAVLLDEPFSGLDPLLREELRTVTITALREAGATAVFVTHDADEALAVADSLAILRAGRLLQAGSPREIYDRPVSAEAAAALGPINRFAAKVQNGQAHSPFGAALAPPDALEGAHVELVVRVEAVEAVPGEGARVVDRRSHGAVDMVRIAAPGGVVWRALVPRTSPLAPGDSADVRIHPPGAFVFASEAR